MDSGATKIVLSKDVTEKMSVLPNAKGKKMKVANGMKSQVIGLLKKFLFGDLLFSVDLLVVQDSPSTS